MDVGKETGLEVLLSDTAAGPWDDDDGADVFILKRLRTKAYMIYESSTKRSQQWLTGSML